MRKFELERFIYSLIAKEKKLEIKKVNHSNKKIRIHINIADIPKEFKNMNFILEFSFSSLTEEPHHIKSNLKFIFNFNGKVCFVIRLDLKEAHQNPSFDDCNMAYIESLAKEETIGAALYDLLDKYEEHLFERNDGHIHIFINSSQKNCDRWAIPINEFINLLKIFNLEKNFQQIETTDITDTIKIIYNFLNLLNFKEFNLLIENIKNNENEYLTLKHM